MNKMKILMIIEETLFEEIEQNTRYEYVSIDALEKVTDIASYQVLLIDLDLVVSEALDTLLSQNETNGFQQYFFISNSLDMAHYKRADEYLLKPVNVETVQDRIHVLMEKRHMKTMQFIYGIEVDYFTVQVYYNSSSLKLTASEFALFAFLYEQKPVEQSFSDIADAIFFSHTRECVEQVRALLDALMRKQPKPFITTESMGLWRYVEIKEKSKSIV